MLKGILPYSAKFYRVLAMGQVKMVETGGHVKCHRVAIGSLTTSALVTPLYSH